MTASGVDGLARSTPAADAYRRVLASLLDAADRNRPGAIDGTDPEHLHDLRVAVRRARTVVGAATGVLPPTELAPLRDELRWLAGETGQPRDLDVWLLGWGDLVVGIPPEDAAALGPLRRHAEGERTRARARLTASLTSERFAATRARWLHLVGSDQRGPDGGRAISEVAASRAQRALDAVLQRGAKVDDESPSEVLHDLRKRAKRLRYLLELFGFALDREAVRHLVPALRRLQDVLGEHQDRSVQVATLRAWADELGTAGAVAPATLVATGVLIAHLRAQQAHARARFPRRFAKLRAAARAHPLG